MEDPRVLNWLSEDLDTEVAIPGSFCSVLVIGKNMPNKPKATKKLSRNQQKVDETGGMCVKRRKANTYRMKKIVLHFPKLEMKNKLGQRNIVHYLDNFQRGIQSTCTLRKASHDILMHNISTISMLKNDSPFDRRVTFIEWHPKDPRILAVGSKSGDVIVWNCGTEILSYQHMIRGKGAGGSILAIKLHPGNDLKIYTASGDGTVCTWNCLKKVCHVFLDTNDYERWYTSLDVSFSGGCLVAGNNIGYLTMLTLQGENLWSLKLHKSKITHAEFNPRESWLLTTTSIDRTVKMWDIRYLKGKESVLTELQHDQAVNSAYFSLTDSSRLLTTDQHNQLRIYRAPLWRLETVIRHPHRQFQHLTPIKATWHPLEDIVVVGRYPDEKFAPGELRTIDFYDAETGLYQYGLIDDFSGIMSVNRFNSMGDTLASGMGRSVIIWSTDMYTVKTFKYGTKCIDWKYER